MFWQQAGTYWRFKHGNFGPCSPKISLLFFSGSQIDFFPLIQIENKIFFNHIKFCQKIVTKIFKIFRTATFFAETKEADWNTWWMLKPPHNPPCHPAQIELCWALCMVIYVILSDK